MLDTSRLPNLSPLIVAQEARAIRTASSALYDNHGDCVARQTAFLTSLAQQHPLAARAAAEAFRKAPASYAAAVQVPETIIGLYAKIIEDRLAVCSKDKP